MKQSNKSNLKAKSKAIALFAFLFLTQCIWQPLSAKNTDYWMGKGRIAISSDGNMHDNDDMQATMMTMMILAKANLQDKVTLYTHSDHIWGSQNNDLEIMTNLVEESCTRFGFYNTNRMAAVSDPDAAYAAMAAEIAASTADDPLFIIAAGPMQVVGESLNKANATNPDALNYVTVISHSKWNNNHSDHAPGGLPPKEDADEPKHSGWIWSEMETSFGSKVNFNYISDQNGTGDKPYESKDKFSAPSWDSWNFMRDHQDPNVKWVFTQGQANPKGPDYSDAGMAYYLVADLDGVRGDDMGNPVKLKNWIGADKIPVAAPDPEKVLSVNISVKDVKIEELGKTFQLSATVMPETALDKSVTWSSADESIATVNADGLVTAVGNGNTRITVTTTDGRKTAYANIKSGTIEASEVTVGDDFIAFEAEATNSSLGKWVIRTPEDPNYIPGDQDVDPINDTYLEYTGSDPGGLGVAKGTDELVYKFTPKTSGVYRLTGRMIQNLDGEAWDKCNDIYIKMEGDFTSGNDVSTDVLKWWCKFYGRGKEKWGSFAKGEPSHGTLKHMEYDLTAGVEYTFSISGRSQRCGIDYFLFFLKGTADITYGENLDPAVENDEKYRPGPKGPCAPDIILSAVDMFKNINVDGFKPAYVHTAKNALAINAAQYKGEWAAANMTFEEAADVYHVTITTLKELDGESSYRLVVNGSVVSTYQNPETTVDYEPSTYTWKNVIINNGDVIQIEFNSHSNGKIPENGGFAYSRGRWTQLALTPTCTGEPVSVTGVELPKDTVKLAPNGVYKLKADVLPKEASIKALKWYVEDPTIGTVEEATGKLTGVASGQTEIYVETVDGGFRDTCVLYIDDNFGSRDIILSHTCPKAINHKGDSFTFDYEATEERDVHFDLKQVKPTWTNSGNVIVTVAPGIGTATVNWAPPAGVDMPLDGEYKFIAYMTPKGGTWKEEVPGTKMEIWVSMSDGSSSIKSISDAKRFSIYPNPANDFLFVKGDDVLNSQVNIYNACGAQVLSTIATKDAISISNLEAGIYFVQIKNNKYTGVKQLIIK